ncbi:hypothetical protein ScPMuIL_017295 [Solemya velum]
MANHTGNLFIGLATVLVLIMRVAPLKMKPEDKYLGCYENIGPRELTGDWMEDKQSNSPEVCKDFCREKGFKYAGTQAGSFCYCGNSYGYRWDNKRKCDIPCPGDSTQKCGSSRHSSVYELDFYIGCFIDQVSRDLSGAFFSKDTMTVQACTGFCQSEGFQYAGLRASKECSCGNTYGRYGMVPPNDCWITSQNKCKGNVNEFCGSHWRNSIYATELVPHNLYIGCYSDSVYHDLDGDSYTDGQAMTPETCSNYCRSKGSNVAGLQAGSECYCGSSFLTYKRANWDECDSPCTGNSSQQCGGTLHNSIYVLDYHYFVDLRL